MRRRSASAARPSGLAGSTAPRRRCGVTLSRRLFPGRERAQTTALLRGLLPFQPLSRGRPQRRPRRTSVSFGSSPFPAANAGIDAVGPSLLLPLRCLSASCFVRPPPLAAVPLPVPPPHHGIDPPAVAVAVAVAPTSFSPSPFKPSSFFSISVVEAPPSSAFFAGALPGLPIAGASLLDVGSLFPGFAPDPPSSSFPLDSGVPLSLAPASPSRSPRPVVDAQTECTTVRGHGLPQVQKLALGRGVRREGGREVVGLDRRLRRGRVRHCVLRQGGVAPAQAGG